MYSAVNTAQLFDTWYKDFQLLYSFAADGSFLLFDFNKVVPTLKK
jgi:hypothetical protein